MISENTNDYTTRLDDLVFFGMKSSTFRPQITSLLPLEVADALNQRIIDAEYYLTDLVETFLNEYPKGEWLGIVRNI